MFLRSVAKPSTTLVCLIFGCVCSILLLSNQMGDNWRWPAESFLADFSMRIAWSVAFLYYVCCLIPALSPKHLTLKTVFLLAMASVGRHSELQALLFVLKYIKSKQKGQVLLYILAPSSCRRSEA